MGERLGRQLVAPTLAGEVAVRGGRAASMWRSWGGEGAWGGGRYITSVYYACCCMKDLWGSMGILSGESGSKTVVTVVVRPDVTIIKIVFAFPA